MALDHAKHIEVVALLRNVIERAPFGRSPDLYPVIEGWLEENHPPPEAYIAALKTPDGEPAARPIFFRYVAQPAGGHIHVRVFAIPEGRDGVLAGTLSFRSEEWAAFKDRINDPDHIEER